MRESVWSNAGWATGLDGAFQGRSGAAHQQEPKQLRMSGLKMGKGFFAALVMLMGKKNDSKMYLGKSTYFFKAT